MNREDELKLRGVALERRIDHHHDLNDLLVWPFLAGFIVLVFAVILIFADEDRNVFWMVVAAVGFTVAMISMYQAYRHQKRAEELEKGAQDNPIVPPGEEA